MSTDWRRLRHAWAHVLLAVIPATFVVSCRPALGETLRLAGDALVELDVLSPTPLTFEFTFPDNVVGVDTMRAWVTGKQILGTFVTMDNGVRNEVSGGAGLTLRVQAPCGGCWEHRSEVQPQGMWDYDATFAWNDEGSGCTADLDALLAAPFTATVLVFPEYEPGVLGWWEPPPAFFLVAVVLEFDVEYGVPAAGMSWSRIQALYD